MPPDAPDWKVIVTLAVAVLGAVGTFIAKTSGAFTAKTTDEEKRRTARDTAATADAELTLTRVRWLVDQLQEENIKKSAEIERVERVCTETKTTLLVRIGELETEIRALKETQSSLEQRLRALREQLQKEL